MDLALLLLLACSPLPTTVSMSGVLLDAPEGLGDAVAGATLATFDSTGADYAAATTDAAGAFAVDVPAGVPFFLTVSAEGLVSTAFNGTAGITDFAASSGYPWIARTSFVDDVRGAHDACTTAAEAGAVMAGDARWAMDGVSGGNLPPADGVEVLVESDDGSVRAACYLDADGASDPDATLTSTNGGFAVFGVPAGAARVQTWHEDSDGNEYIAEFQFVVPEDGLVPMFPLAVP